MSVIKDAGIKDNMTVRFFELYRKKGADQVLRILEGLGLKGAPESEFNKIMKREKIFMNEFYRSKNALIKYGLIGYCLDKEYQKQIFLTEKGFDLVKMIDEIIEIFERK